MKECFQTLHGNEFETPDWLFKHLDSEFHFTHDLACSKDNMKCQNGLCVEQVDALAVDWHLLSKGWMWLNPPYSPLKPWVQKAQKEFLLGAKIVVLMPPVLSSRYFSQVPPSQVRLIVGRIGFVKNGKEMKGNMADSCLVIYGPPVRTDFVWLERDSIKGKST
jgi:phage N-6-adenine-methyltransferase